MKQKLFEILTFAAFIIAILAVFIASYLLVKLEPREQVYPLTAQIVELDRANDIVTCEDGAGLLWQFEGCEDWEEGDIASLLMNDNATPDNVFDDIIEMVRYAGF